MAQKLANKRSANGTKDHRKVRKPRRIRLPCRNGLVQHRFVRSHASVLWQRDDELDRGGAIRGYFDLFGEKTGRLVPCNDCVGARRDPVKREIARAIRDCTPPVWTYYHGCRHVWMQPAINKHDPRP